MIITTQQDVEREARISGFSNRLHTKRNQRVVIHCFKNVQHTLSVMLIYHALTWSKGNHLIR